MPKKVRGGSSKPAAKRARRPMPQPRQVGATPLAPRSYAAPVARTAAASPSPGPTGRVRHQAVLSDYSYVGPELRRIGTFAAVIFVIMGILAVIIR